MQQGELKRRLMATFLVELQEHTGVLNRELVALERQPQSTTAAESIKTLFHAAHNANGAARSVNAGELESVCRELEELLAAIRDGSRALSAETFERLFRLADAFEAASQALAASQIDGVQDRPAPARGAEVGARGAAPSSAPRSAVSEPDGDAERLTRSPSVATTTTTTTVRVPGARLDALLAQSGELLSARRRLDARRDELVALQESVSSFHAKWLDGSHSRGRRPSKASDAAGSAARDLRESSAAVFLDPNKGMAQLAREYLGRFERDLGRFATSLAEDAQALTRAAAALHEQIHQVRMRPIAEACEGLQRLVRELALAQHKDVELSLEGTETELDRAVIDGLHDALLQLVRNAVDHGIEPPEQRAASGKPRRATIKVSAALRGETVEVVVADDGRGVDLAAVRARARETGAPEPDDDRELARLVFEPWFSTKPTVTHVAGRGVGLDIVKTQVEGLRGRADLAVEPGRGTRFTLTLPLTLTTERVLLAVAAGEIFAFPSASVRRLTRVAKAELRVLDGWDMLPLDGPPCPLVSLAGMLGLRADEPASASNKVSVVLLGREHPELALAVDELMLEQEVVLKPLGERIGRMRYVSAATLLPTGRIGLLLKPFDLIRDARLRERALPEGPP